MRSLMRKSLILAVALLAGVMTTAFKAEGLEVLFALYGDLNADKSANKRQDVTAIVKAQVGSQEAYGFNERVKNSMFTAAGIDPAPGVVKGLLVVYGNAGKVYLHFSNYYDTTTMPDNTDYCLGIFTGSELKNAVQIQAAIYGDLNKSGSTSKSDFAKSKETATARLFQNNAMTIPPLATGEQKHQLFGDPAVGVNKGFLAVISSWTTLSIGCYGQTEAGTLSSTSYQFSATVGSATSAPVRIKWTQTRLGASAIAASGYVDLFSQPNRIDPSRGKVWIALPSTTWNKKIRDWNGSDWNPDVPDYPVGITSIAVDLSGRPWIRNFEGIQSTVNGKWIKLPGCNPASNPHSIAVGYGKCWYIGKSGMVYAFDTACRENIDGGILKSVTPDSVSAPPGGATSIYYVENRLCVVGPSGLFSSNLNGPWPPGSWTQVNTGNMKVTAFAEGNIQTTGGTVRPRLYVLGDDFKIYGAWFKDDGSLSTTVINQQPAVYPNENNPLPVSDIAVEDGLESGGGLRIWAIDRAGYIYRSEPTLQ